MADLAELCNLALSRVGESRVIADVEFDTSPGALSFRRAYPIARDATLAGADWGFARRIFQPGLADIAAPGASAVGSYPYLFRRPADCVAFRGLFAWPDCWGDPEAVETYNLPNAQGLDTVYLSCRLPEPWMRYTRRVEDVSLFSVLFVESLAWRLGMDLAMTVARSLEIQQRCAQMFVQRIGEARAVAMQEQPRQAPESELITGRWGSRRPLIPGDDWSRWIGYGNRIVGY